MENCKKNYISLSSIIFLVKRAVDTRMYSSQFIIFLLASSHLQVNGLLFCRSMIFILIEWWALGWKEKLERSFLRKVIQLILRFFTQYHHNWTKLLSLTHSPSINFDSVNVKMSLSKYQIYSCVKYQTRKENQKPHFSVYKVWTWNDFCACFDTYLSLLLI